MPRRFQQRRAAGWSKPPGSRCVSRPSRYGNPFQPAVLGDPGSHAAACDRFREWTTAPEQGELRARARRELRGRDLGCYCAPHLPCHADVLLELAND